MDVKALVATIAEEQPAVEYVDGEDSTVRTGWQMRTTSDADFGLERITALKKEEAELDAQIEAVVCRARARGEQIRASIHRGISFFESCLFRYATENRESLLGGGKKKSRDLLSGTIGWRKRGGKLVVADKAALVAWLECQPPESGLYRLKVEPEMKAIQDAFKATGLVPPGLEYEPEEETFYVKTPETGMVKP